MRKVAKWNDIRNLYRMESKWSKVAVGPTVLNVSALTTHPLAEDTDGNLLSQFIAFWKIVYVRSQYLDVAKRDPLNN